MLEKVESFISQLLNTCLDPKYHYHNLAHTQRVVGSATLLCENMSFSDLQKEHILIACWFHDVGFIHTEEGHEKESARIAQSYLSQEGYPTEGIEAVMALIRQTEMSRIPESESEKVMKDADCSHLGMADFWEISELLHQEVNLTKAKDVSQLEWYEGNLKFMQKHTFYTSFALENWQAVKMQHEEKLQTKIAELRLEAEQNPNTDEDSSEIKELPKKKMKYGRGVETMFRTTLKNHLELSAIADSKANILLSVNAIIISIALSNLIPKLDNNSFLVVPTLVLIIFSVTSVILSVLSTRPNISNVKVTRDMVRNKQTNILFFGNFFKMGLKDFEWGIQYLIDHEDVLYNSMTKDLYYLGLVLERKYRLLRITYTVFMIGIVLSSLAFVISYYVYFVKES